MKKSRAALALLAVGASLLVAVAGSAAASCAPADHAGGEWRSYGQDLTNARNQSSETEIGPDTVASLSTTYAFSVSRNAGAGAINSTPVVADGCLFVGTSLGSVFAANADTGETVWSTRLTRVEGLPAGANIMSPSVVDGRVHVIGNLGKPFAAALDQATGKVLWQTDMIEKDAGLFDAASSVVANGLVFLATTWGDVIDPTSRPPFYILDATNGAVLKKTYVIPMEDGLQGYSGGGIWSTAAVDTTTNYLYAGTANPYSRRLEHKYTNALIKVDFDRTRSTFGEIVASYRGDSDANPALVNTPQCQLLGDIPLAGYGFFCGQQDIDFGASPQLFTDSTGRKLIGDLQKSGVYHVADAETMAPVWKARLAPFYRVGGHSATAAFDDHAIYVNTDEGKLDALDKDTGARLWTASYKDPGGKYQPVSVANGVVYVSHKNGSLHAFDAQTGQELFTTAPEIDGATCSGTSAAGIAIARNTVYFGCDSGSDRAGMVFALRVS